MPNRHKEPLLPWAPQDQGAAAGPASSRSPHCHFMYFFWVHTTPLRPSAVAERLSGGSLLLAGSLLPGGFVPPPRLSCWERGRAAGQSARRCSERCQLAWERPAPSQLHFKAKLLLFKMLSQALDETTLPRFLPGAGREQPGGCSRAPGGDVGPSAQHWGPCSLCASPWESPTETKRKPRRFCRFLEPSFGHPERIYIRAPAP